MSQVGPKPVDLALFVVKKRASPHRGKQISGLGPYRCGFGLTDGVVEGGELSQVEGFGAGLGRDRSGVERLLNVVGGVGGGAEVVH